MKSRCVSSLMLLCLLPTGLSQQILRTEELDALDVSTECRANIEKINDNDGLNNAFDAFLESLASSSPQVGEDLIEVLIASRNGTEQSFSAACVAAGGRRSDDIQFAAHCPVIDTATGESKELHIDVPVFVTCIGDVCSAAEEEIYLRGVVDVWSFFVNFPIEESDLFNSTDEDCLIRAIFPSGATVGGFAWATLIWLGSVLLQ